MPLTHSNMYSVPSGPNSHADRIDDRRFGRHDFDFDARGRLISGQFGIQRPLVNHLDPGRRRFGGALNLVVVEFRFWDGRNGMP